MIGFAVFGAVLLVLTAVVSRVGASDGDATGKIDTVADQLESPLARAGLRATKPLASSKLVNIPQDSPLYEGLRLRLAAAGGAFGGLVEVFLAVQVALTIASVAVLSFVIVSDLSTAQNFIACIIAIAMVLLPSSRLKDQAKTRAVEIDVSLATFAERLIIPLKSGYGLIAALGYTTRRVSGPVSEEVENLLAVISNRSRAEDQAFREAGEHLGTDASKTFFASLAQAHLEGVKVSDTVANQARMLRITNFENRRALIGKAKPKMTAVTVVCFLPLLFVLLLYPSLVTLTGQVQ